MAVTVMEDLTIPDDNTKDWLWEDSWAFSDTLYRRTKHQLSHSTIALHWEISPTARMRKAHIPHILTIVDEVLSNVIRHSKATNLRVEYLRMDLYKCSGNTFSFADNGKGFMRANRVPRRGLSKIQQIADALGGKLTILSDISGTQVKFWLPE